MFYLVTMRNIIVLVFSLLLTTASFAVKDSEIADLFVDSFDVHFRLHRYFHPLPGNTGDVHMDYYLESQFNDLKTSKSDLYVQLFSESLLQMEVIELDESINDISKAVLKFQYRYFPLKHGKKSAWVKLDYALSPDNYRARVKKELSSNPNLATKLIFHPDHEIFTLAVAGWVDNFEEVTKGTTKEEFKRFIRMSQCFGMHATPVYYCWALATRDSRQNLVSHVVKSDHKLALQEIARVANYVNGSYRIQLLREAEEYSANIPNSVRKLFISDLKYRIAPE
jgi:hypothetical protein